MATWHRLLPWAFLLLALPVALLILAETSSDACGELPGAFADDVTTERTEVLEGVVASTCQTRDVLSAEEVDSMTIVNWTGIIAAIGIGAIAWLAGALIVGRVRSATPCPRRCGRAVTRPA